MKTLSKLLVTITCMCATSVAFAKNKEACKASGGHWVAGSATNAEVGGCFYFIRANKTVDIGTARAVDKPISVVDCANRNGKITNEGTQCVVQFGAPTSKPSPK
jgi:hypothetical protein